MENCKSFDRGQPHRFLIRAYEMSPDNPVFMRVGNWIASGKYADIHEMDDGRVIRFARCSKYDWKTYSQTLERMRKRPHPSIVRVYEYGMLGELEHEEFPGEFWTYFYTITERLHPITDESEGEAVCFEIEKALVGGAPTLDGRLPRSKVSRLRRTFRRFPFFHVDLHWGNVMKDDDGNYKLIDLDSLE